MGFGASRAQALGEQGHVSRGSWAAWLRIFAVNGTDFSVACLRGVQRLCRFSSAGKALIPADERSSDRCEQRPGKMQTTGTSRGSLVKASERTSRSAGVGDRPSAAAVRCGGHCGACGARSWPPQLVWVAEVTPRAGGGSVRACDHDRLGPSAGSWGDSIATCPTRNGTRSSLVHLGLCASLGDGAVLSLLRHMEIHVRAAPWPFRAGRPPSAAETGTWAVAAPRRAPSSRCVRSLETRGHSHSGVTVPAKARRRGRGVRRRRVPVSAPLCSQQLLFSEILDLEPAACSSSLSGAVTGGSSGPVTRPEGADGVCRGEPGERTPPLIRAHGGWVPDGRGNARNKRQGPTPRGRHERETRGPLAWGREGALQTQASFMMKTPELGVRPPHVAEAVCGPPAAALAGRERELPSRVRSTGPAAAMSRPRLLAVLAGAAGPEEE